MRSHILANLWLLAVTLVLCSGLYPLALLGAARLLPAQAEGSLVRDRSGTVVGSRLIAQPFTGDEWFWPRPSAVSHKADASGGSNLSANNPALRDRVARALGPVVRYRDGSGKSGPVGPDIEAWFRSQPGLVARWATTYPTSVQAWVKADPLNEAYVKAWMEGHPGAVAGWKRANAGDPKPADLAADFFADFAASHPGAWPALVETKGAGGTPDKSVGPVTAGADIQSYFFESWLAAHPDAVLEEVPADMVMTSGSGLDPHITLANARYQLDRVAAARAAKTGKDMGQVRRQIEQILAKHAAAPLGGLVGPPLVNVLEVNLELDAAFGGVKTAAR